MVLPLIKNFTFLVLSCLSCSVRMHIPLTKVKALLEAEEAWELSGGQVIRRYFQGQPDLLIPSCPRRRVQMPFKLQNHGV